jgi:Fe-S cluster biogenesis protein NfuA
MFIEYEETPNPNTLKFIPGQMVLEKGTRDYKNAEDAQHSPLALRLFGLAGVRGVFLSGHFVSVTRDDVTDWPMLQPMILTALMEHFSTGQPVLDEPESAPDASADDAEESEIDRQIKELLDTRVKPAVAMDGGNIEFVEFDDGVVYLRMEGACAGCPSSTQTLKHGIEELLKHFIPEVERVEQEAAF